jgi:hypothetical protein
LRAGAQLCLRPVSPGPSAWHEMPGQVARGSLALQGQFSGERCGFGVSRVCGGGPWVAGDLWSGPEQCSLMGVGAPTVTIAAIGISRDVCISRPRI